MLSAQDFFFRFRQAAANRDSLAVAKLMDLEISSGRAPSGTHPVFQFIEDFSSASMSSDDATALEFLCSAFRRFSEWSQSEECSWLLSAQLRLHAKLRKLAAKLDSRDGSLKWSKKVVEVHREVFPGYYRDKTKIAETASVTTELLRLYLRLDQPGLCGPVVATLQQGGAFDPRYVPKAVACTLYFFWGRLLISQERFRAAAGKLEWAAENCSHASRNFQKILEYLIPCKMAMGSLPSPSLLERSGLLHYAGICKAVASGDIKLFNDELQKNMELFIRSGTFLLIEKVKLICYRSMLRRLVELCDPETTSRIDLAPIEHVWKLSEGFDRNEVLSALATLIFMGALKGYLSYEHNKLVISKTGAFPPVVKWDW